MKFILSALALHVGSWAQPIPAAHVESHGSRIFISNGSLTKSSIDAVEALSRGKTLTEAQKLHLKDIPGGNLGATYRLYNAFAGKMVEVDGYCGSACANLALAGSEVQMNRDGLLFIHGIYLRDSGQWIEKDSLELVDWYASRLPTVPREALVAAVSFRDPNGRGLVVYPLTDGSGLIAVRLCDPLPDNCRIVRYLSPGESRLTVSPELRPKGR